jgi:hypothetical protein
MQETFYEFDDIRDRIIGAGILPVAIDEKGEVHMMLGKERYINHWRGSLKWSGFEGGRKCGEDVEQTAAREFIEESLGVIQLDNKEPTVEGVAEMLRKGEYVARIVLCIVHGEEVERRYHVTYVVEIPYNATHPDQFSTRRRLFVDLHSKSLQLSRLLDQIVDTRLPYEKSCYETIRITAVTRVERLAPHLLRIEFVDDSDNMHVHEMNSVNEDDCFAYTRWFGMRQTCTNDVNGIDFCKHAITMDRDARNLVTAIKVNEDYVEKQTMQWWCAKELYTVIDNGGFINSDFFRAYFLPVLQRALIEIAPRE